MLDQAPPPPVIEAAAPAPVIPAELRAILDQAIAEGDERVIDKIFDYAKRARPDLAALLSDLRKGHREEIAAREAAAAEKKRRKLADAGPLENWSGNLEFGATLTTGQTDSIGGIAALDLKREGLNWAHALLVKGEIQETNGVRAVERVIASWQPRYNLAPKSYVFGLGQFERDPELGYDARYTAGIGAGWSLASGKALKLSVEGGPALRRTLQDHHDYTRLAGRGTLDLSLAISPRLDFGQRISVFYEAGTSSGLFTSKLDSRISEKLKLRLSYEYRVEEDGLTGASSSGSISRASIVYKL